MYILTYAIDSACFIKQLITLLSVLITFGVFCNYCFYNLEVRTRIQIISSNWPFIFMAQGLHVLHVNWHTDTHTYTHRDTHTLTHVRSCTQMQAHTQKHTHTHTTWHLYKHSHMHTMVISVHFYPPNLVTTTFLNLTPNSFFSFPTPVINKSPLMIYWLIDWLINSFIELIDQLLIDWSIDLIFRDNPLSFSHIHSFTA